MRSASLLEPSCWLCSAGATRTAHGTHFVDRGNGKLEQQPCPDVRFVSSQSVRRLEDAFETASGNLGCSDGACEFRAQPGAMATSRGCRCRNRPLGMSSLAELYRAVEQYLQGVAR